mgnify:CR=1 FL=1
MIQGRDWRLVNLQYIISSLFLTFFKPIPSPLFPFRFPFLGTLFSILNSILVSEVFKSIKKFRLESTFSTWLYRIAINTCKNRIKSSAYKWKKKTVSLETSNGSKNGNPFSEIVNGSPTPAMAFEKKERMMRIQNAINSLPEEQNKVVVLRDIQGLSYQDISDITGLNPGTVKSRLARGRLALKNQLKGRI